MGRRSDTLRNKTPMIDVLVRMTLPGVQKKMGGTHNGNSALSGQG
jgi:hypothetical protein